MEQKVFGLKSIWTPKIFGAAYFVFGVVAIFLLVYEDYLAASGFFVGLLFLRILYEFLMSSFKATEHLYRIAESLDKKEG